MSNTQDELGVNHPMYPIFMDAIEQATGGKGQRHGGARTPFMEQPWHQIAKHTGFRGLVFQAVKKAQEACGKDDYEAFEREMLGSLVYSAMALIHARKYGYTKEVKVDAVSAPDKPNPSDLYPGRIYIKGIAPNKFEVIQHKGCGNGNDALLGSFSTIEEAIAFADKKRAEAEGNK